MQHPLRRSYRNSPTFPKIREKNGRLLKVAAVPVGRTEDAGCPQKFFFCLLGSESEPEEHDVLSSSQPLISSALGYKMNVPSQTVIFIYGIPANTRDLFA